MKYSEPEKKDMAAPSFVADQPSYPYGLRISLDPDSLGKLDLPSQPKVGEKKMLLAVAEVVSVRKEPGRGDESKVSVELQIQQLECKGHEEKKSPEQSLYGDKGE